MEPMLGGAAAQVKRLSAKGFARNKPPRLRRDLLNVAVRTTIALMRRSTEVLLTMCGLVAVPLGVLVFNFAGLPEQPPHPALARVVAINPHDSRIHADRDTIVVRNAHGTGEFSMHDAEVRCVVGDQVPVEQRGLTLTPTSKTCR
jgi:hypothetical protein